MPVNSKDKLIEKIKESRRKFYNNRAKIYDKLQFSNKAFFDELKGFKNLVKVKKSDIVLDIATGTGIYLIEMAKKGAICYGLDISRI